MKAFALLLVLANLAVLAYFQIESLGSGETNRLAQQVQPEKIKPFSHAQVKTMGLDKPAPPALCLEWGPFSEGEKPRAMPVLQELAQSRALSSKAVEVTTAYWVYVPPLANKPAAEKKITELRSLGINELYLVQENSPQKWAISLGLFRSEEAANNYLAAMQELGVKSARIAPRTQTLSQTLLVMRDPNPDFLVRLQGLKADFPSAEARLSPCNGKPAG